MSIKSSEVADRWASAMSGGVVMQAAFLFFRRRFLDRKGNEDWDLGLFLAILCYAIYARLCISGRGTVARWSVIGPERRTSLF